MTVGRRRRGYALAMVVAFVVFFLALWGVAASQVGAMLGIEQARSRRIRRDELGARAVVRGLAALKVGYPPSPAYFCSIQIDANEFTLQYTLIDAPSGRWSVKATAGASADVPRFDPRQFRPTPPS